MSTRAVIVDVVRSPMAKGRAPSGGRPGGALSSVHPVELLGQVLAALLQRNDLDPALVEDVIVGCVSQADEQAGPIGRWAWLSAGLPHTVPSVAINRACGSSHQAFDFAAQGIIAGAYDVVVAAGVESMSRVPMFTARMGADIYGPGVDRRYAPGLVPQGVSAELVADRWNMSREDLDEYSARSHMLAHRADNAAQIVPIVTPDGATVAADETIRPDTTVESLARLKPVFGSEDYVRRFPGIDWKVTAGNSSQITDGAAAALLMSEEAANRLGLRPRARVHSFAVVGDDPIMMLTGPIPATEKVLARSGFTIDEMDQVEINEAFAPVPIAWREHFRYDPDRLNPRGGAIALGHPLGASGIRLMGSLLAGLESSGGRLGLQTICEAGGMANATIVERV
jgi:acetyl-CoA acyltransferase